MEIEGHRCRDGAEGIEEHAARTLTDGGRCDEGALGDDAGLASGHAGERGALLRLAGSTPMDRGHAYRGSERLSEHREGVWLGQLRVCRAWMRPLMEISDEARLKHPRSRGEYWGLRFEAP